MNQVIAGYLLIVFFLILLTYPHLRRLPPWGRLRLPWTSPLKVGLTSLLIGGALVMLLFPLGLRSSFYAACRSCPLYTGGEGYSLSRVTTQFPRLIFLHTATTIPIFILGCFIASLVGQISFKLWPKDLFSSFLLAAVLPLCSCGVIPIVKAMLEQPHLHKRVVGAFLITAPLLSPLIVVLSWGVLGVRYTLLRIASTFSLALMGGGLLSRLWVKHRQTRGTSVAGGVVISQNPLARFPLPLRTWEYIASLFKFIGLGLLLGAAFAALIPSSFLRIFLQHGLGGLLALASVGIPIHLCSGTEVLILSPFMQMGMPLGHALTFSIAGAGICLSSLPPLLKVLGRKVTTWLLIYLWIGSVVIGGVINLMLPLIGKQMEVL